jgi:hypothetical protein
VPGPVTADEMRAAQLLTGATMAVWLATGWVPGLRPYVARIRAVLLLAYLGVCAAFAAYVLMR